MSPTIISIQILRMNPRVIFSSGFSSLKKSPEDQNLDVIQDLRKNIDRSKYGFLQKELKKMLIDWEEEDKKVRNLWRKMNDWAEEGFKQTFETFKIQHDKTYFESKLLPTKNLYNHKSDCLLIIHIITCSGQLYFYHQVL